MLSQKTNLVCMRHPKYDGVESPDLACKVCCSKFVERIRAEQSNLFEVTSKPRHTAKQDFTPMTAKSLDVQKSKRQANFDGSWI